MTAAGLAAVPEVIEAAGDWVDVSALRVAWEARDDAPVVWAVVGRRSVGKSSVVNALVHAGARTGLGGVTTETTRYEGEGLALLDTAGMEDPLEAADRLETLLSRVDGLIWVVDGLQPLTRIEREALDDAVPPDVAVVVLVTRLDLVDPEERPAILQRVRVGTSRRAPLGVHAVDGRAEEVRALLPRPPWWRSPARRQALRAAVEGVERSLAHLPLPPDPAGILERVAKTWHEEVHDAHDLVAAQARDGRHLFRDQALAELHRRVVEAWQGANDTLRRELGGSPWTPPAPEGLDLAGQLQDLVSGTAGVLRGLRAGASAWVAEGELAIRQLSRGAAARALEQRRISLESAKEAVQRALTPPC